MDVKLVMFKPDGQRKDFRIHKDKTILGRGTDCDLRVPLLNVSRQHCELVLDDEKLALRDLTSSNGTFVNNHRVTETALNPGDRIKLGPVVFTVQIDGVPAEIAPVESKAAAVATEDDIVDLEADILEPLNTDGEDSDPMAALDAALADLADEDEDDK